MKKDWRDIWWLTGRDLREKRWSLLLSTLFFALLGLNGSLIGRSVWETKEAAEWNGFAEAMLGFYLIAMSGVLGFGFCRDYRNYWRTSNFTKKLAFLRSLPMKAEVIVSSRLIVMIATSVLMGTAFFTTMYFTAASIQEMLDGEAFVRFALVAWGYAVAIGGGYLYLELGYREKTYFLINLALLPVFFLIPLLFWVTGESLVSRVFALVRETNWVLPAAAIVCGFLILLLLRTIIVRRVRARDIH